MTSLSFYIPGEPYAQKRHRSRVVAPKGRTPFATVYDPPENKNRKAEAQYWMREAANLGEPPILLVPFADEPLELRVRAIFTLPRSQHRKRTPRPRSPHAKSPDLDNLLKWIMDAGTGVLWTDDKQICRVEIEKLTGAQGEAPRTLVSVSGLGVSASRASVTIVTDERDEAVRLLRADGWVSTEERPPSPGNEHDLTVPVYGQNWFQVYWQGEYYLMHYGSDRKWRDEDWEVNDGRTKPEYYRPLPAPPEKAEEVSDGR